MKTTHGFTLIELLITITIATILATLGFSAYSTGRSKQDVKSATTTLTSLLDNTHKLSLVGTRPDDCTGSFMGYQLSTTALSNTIITTPLCNTTNGQAVTHTINNLTFTDNIDIVYRPLVGGLDLNGASSINLDYLDANASTHRLTINQSGSYSYEGIIQ